MKSTDKIFNPVTVLVIAAIVISFSGVFVKISHVSSTVSAFYRVLFGSLFLIIACFVRKEFTKRTPKNNFYAIICGLLFAFDLWAWHLSIQYIGPGLATILGNCQVFVLSLVGFLIFKEKISITFILSLPLAFFGLFLLIGVDIDQLSPDYMAGIYLGIATAIFYSLFLLLLRKIQSDKEDFSLFYYLMMLSVACTVFLGGKIVITGESFVIPDGVTLLSLLSLGLFVQAMAWVGISNSLPKVNASHAGLILLLQPALSFIWDVIFFDRQTGLAGWSGLMIVLIAIYMGMAKNKKKE